MKKVFNMAKHVRGSTQLETYKDTDQIMNTYDDTISSSSSIEIFSKNRNELEKYSKKYRFFKAILLIFAWIAFGFNLEVIGPTLEDLRHFLNINYVQISLSLALRNLGFLCMTLVFGLVLDKVGNYIDIWMAFSSATISIVNFLLPITKVYFLSLLYFLVQGLSQAVYELGGNFIILNLYTGTSNSYINSMHAGYGMIYFFGFFLVLFFS
jgi:fucose permease